MDLGPDVITEVEIQPEMQEVEIESLPVDMSGDETIEISVDDDVGLGDDDEVMLQTQEEVVGYEDPSMALVSEAGIFSAARPSVCRSRPGPDVRSWRDKTPP